jgi:aarF domain-containing kinase
MREMSSQMKEMRKQMNSEIAKDERASLMMDALRGKGMNDADRQREGVDMLVVTMQDIDGSSLPTEYNPAKLEAFFSRRPGAVFSRYSHRQFMKPLNELEHRSLSRVYQIFSNSFRLLVKVAFDILSKDPDLDVKRAAELRDTIVSLGPFFIKVLILAIYDPILSTELMKHLFPWSFLYQAR